MNAVPGVSSQRNRHVEKISERGRMAWQVATGYNQRSRIETQIGRWKTVIGERLQAMYFDNQTCETQIAANVLNRMTALGRANYAWAV